MACVSFVLMQRQSRNAAASENLASKRGAWRVRQVCALLALVPAGWSQELTLEEAVQTAIQNNRQVRIARLEFSKSEAAVRAAQTYRLPSFSVRFFEQQPLSHINFNIPPGTLGSFAATGPIPPGSATIRNPMQPMSIALAGVDQPLTQLRRIDLGIQLQNLKREEAASKLREQEQVVSSEVKKAYYALLQTQSALDVTADTLKLFNEVQRVAEQGSVEKVVLQGELLEVKTRVAQTQLEQMSLRNSIETQKGALNILLGRSINTDFRVASAEQTATLEIDPAAARARALAQRPELEQARLRILQAERDAKLKRAEAIPDISLSVNYLGLGNIKFLPSNTLLAGVSVKWDVFDWGRKGYELAAKKDAIQQAKEAFAETEARIQLEVDSNRRKLEENQARLKVSDLRRQTAAEMLRVSKDKWEEKTIQMKDVLQFQTSLTQANYEYQKDLLAFWTTKAEFDKALGEK